MSRSYFYALFSPREFSERMFLIRWLTLVPVGQTMCSCGRPSDSSWTCVGALDPTTAVGQTMTALMWLNLRFQVDRLCVGRFTLRFQSDRLCWCDWPYYSSWTDYDCVDLIDLLIPDGQTVCWCALSSIPVGLTMTVLLWLTLRFQVDRLWLGWYDWPSDSMCADYVPVSLTLLFQVDWLWLCWCGWPSDSSWTDYNCVGAVDPPISSWTDYNCVGAVDPPISSWTDYDCVYAYLCFRRRPEAPVDYVATYYQPHCILQDNTSR